MVAIKHPDKYSIMIIYRGQCYSCYTVVKVLIWQFVVIIMACDSTDGVGWFRDGVNSVLLRSSVLLLLVLRLLLRLLTHMLQPPLLQPPPPLLLLPMSIYTECCSVVSLNRCLFGQRSYDCCFLLNTNRWVKSTIHIFNLLSNEFGDAVKFGVSAKHPRY